MFGEQLKKLRLSQNLSQVDLANKLGVSKQTVSNWENNNITPSIDKLIDIAKFFSCSSDYLLELVYDKTITLSKQMILLIHNLLISNRFFPITVH